MDDEIDECIRNRIQWPQLPTGVKKLLGDSPKEYERYIFEFSIKNQLRYRGSLVRSVRKDERKYYEVLVQSSIQRLMLYPYHLADMIVKGLRITPFIYYVEVVALLIEMEKSYDTLPNFTAADCLRLLGIGRNEYLELIAKARSLRRRGRAKAIRALLPRVPLNIPMLPWWRVELGYVLEEDVKPLSDSEKALIDLLIDRGSQTAGILDYNVVKTLYRRGLIYLDVPITSADKVSVPPLKGFVMNRIAGDYFETLLYKVFVSVDEHTSVAELAAVLQVDCELVKQAISLYCRLGFANNLNPPPVSPQHLSWKDAITTHKHQPYRQIAPLTFDPNVDEDALQMEPVLIKDSPSTSKQSYQDICDIATNNSGQRVAVLFDSTLAAYLMMGNLSPDLKSHAVTLFEVGKLCDESLDSLLMELDKVVADPEIEGEARRYLAAAACLRIALRTLRPSLRPLDLLRCEALHALGPAARARLFATKYRLAISTAPLSREARAGTVAGALPHVGPAPPEASSPWMRLYLYHVAGYGPPTLLLTKGTVLRSVPRALLGFARLSVWWWGAEGEGAALPAAAALAAANSALRRAPVLLQAAAVRHQPRLRHLAFPPHARDGAEAGAGAGAETEAAALWRSHGGLRRLARRLRLARAAGYVALADIGVPDLGCARPPPQVHLVPQRNKKEVCGVAKPLSEVSLSSNDSVDKTTEYAKPVNSRLQSPIESYFAVTPTTESKTSSPANGFTSAEGGKLLCEELDNLNIDDNLMHRSKESICASDDFVAIHSSSNSIEELKKHSSEKSISKDSISFSDDLVPMHSSSTSVENLKFDSKNKEDDKTTSQLNDLLSPAEESVSMFTQLSDKLTEITEGDSGVDTAHNFSDEETCKPEKWTILDLQFGIPLFDEALCERVCQSIVDRIAKPEILEKIKEDNEFIRSDVLKFVSQCQYYPGEDMGIVKRGTLVPLPRKNLVFENGRITEWNGK